MIKRTFLVIGMVAVLVLGSAAHFGLVFGDSNSAFVFPQYSMKVSLDFKNADLKDVLKAFSKQSSMNFLTEQDADVKGITVLLSDVPIEEALEKILSAYGLVYEYDVANNLVLVKKKPKEAPAVLVTRVYQLKFASVPGSAVGREMGGVGSLSTGLAGGGGKGGGGGSGGIVAVLKAAISKAKVSGGAAGSVVEDERTNSLIITDVPENFPNIERLLARLDVPVPVVMIEVEMLDISKDTSDQIGFNWSTGMSFTGGSRSIHFPYHGGLGSVPTQGALGFGSVGAVLSFIKSRDDTKSLARPRIMTLDNQTASIRISTNEAIGETTTNSATPTATSNASSTSSAERYTTGILMTVTPQISLLTDEITLIVEPKVIDANKSVTFKSGNTYKNPEERGVKSILKVKNGETIIMGGLLRNQDSLSTSRIPFLGDLPLVGNFFRNKTKIQSTRELVVFITPRIMGSSDQDDGEQKEVAEGVLKGEQSISDMRTGMIRQEMDRIADK